MANKNLNIKNLKPKKYSYYKQGVLDPKRFKKYVNECIDDPIIYRSGLELQFINYCENNANITKWASEPVVISYVNPIDKKEHKYYPDFLIENKQGVRCLVEVKPYGQTVKPKITDSVWLKEQWIKNVSKWTYAKEYSKKHNFKFIIVTEKFFE